MFRSIRKWQFCPCSFQRLFTKNIRTFCCEILLALSSFELTILFCGCSHCGFVYFLELDIIFLNLYLHNEVTSIFVGETWYPHALNYFGCSIKPAIFFLLRSDIWTNHVPRMSGETYDTDHPPSTCLFWQKLDQCPLQNTCDAGEERGGEGYCCHDNHLKTRRSTCTNTSS